MKAPPVRRPWYNSSDEESANSSHSELRKARVSKAANLSSKKTTTAVSSQRSRVSGKHVPSPSSCFSMAFSLLPSLCLFAVLCGTSLHHVVTPVQLGKQLPHFDAFVVVLNQIVASAGPALPSVVLLSQWCTLPYASVVGKSSSIGEGKAFLFWCLMAGLRLALFLAVRPYNYYFSDHIFLITCLIGQIQMQLFLCHFSQTHGVGLKCCSNLSFVLGWLVVCPLLVESWFTATYFHTVFAVWAAFLAGTLLFSGIALYWMTLVKRAAAELSASNYQLLDVA